MINVFGLSSKQIIPGTIEPDAMGKVFLGPSIRHLKANIYDVNPIFKKW